MHRLGYLGTLGKKVAVAAAPPKPVEVQTQTVEVPFLSVSESAVPVPQSTSPVEEVPVVTEEPSEEQCASPQVPASTVSSHTE